MSDDKPNDTTTTASTTGDQPGTAPAEGKAFTQEQVNAIVSRRLQEDRASRAKPAESKPTEPTGSAATDTDLKAKVEELEMRNAFDKRAAKLGLTDDAEALMFKLYKADRPSDPAAWFESTGKAFGLKGTTTATATPQDPAKPPAAAPSSSQPSAVTPVTTGGLVDIYTMTPEQFASMSPQQMREHHEKNLAAAQSRAGGPRLPRMLQKG